jgi:4-diphosphocytidyl-2-C-methyl-D-erythritol kinase
MISVLAPAKVNLALHVTGRRADGYHEIETLALFAAMADRLTAREAATTGLSISGPFAGGLSAEADNLVLRAAVALRNVARLQVPETAFQLEKNLPVASGIGGGSADAAAALIALKALWNLPADHDLGPVAGRLGADVPMCLASVPLVARGTGERIEAVTIARSLPCVLVNPGIAVSTRDVFSALARRDNPPMENLPAGGPDIEWLMRQRNDLEAPAMALCPQIGTAIAMLEARTGLLLARMSGSGATCFGLFATGTEADEAAREIGAREPGWWCVATQLLAGEYPGRITRGEERDGKD